MLLSEHSDLISGSGFADGLEIEETFPEAAADATTTPRLALVPAHSVTPDAVVPADLDVRLERRLREAEARLKESIDQMLSEWQSRFEKTLEQRHLADERASEVRRQTEEQRLQALRAELEAAVEKRFAEHRPADRAHVPDRSGEMRVTLRDAVMSAQTARDVGRVLRDAVAELARTASFSLAIHQSGGDEVAYRYRVAVDGDLGAALRVEPLDDAPHSAVAHSDGWIRGQRVVHVAGRNITVHTAQRAVRVHDQTVAVLTLQTERDAIADSLLSRIDDLARLVGPRLFELRARGSLRGA